MTDPSDALPSFQEALSSGDLLKLSRPGLIDRNLWLHVDQPVAAEVLASIHPSDRARFTKRRKEAYEALHPEARHGGDRKSDQVAKSATRSFSEDQANATGMAERTVRLDAERGEKVCDEALDLIKGTRFDTGA